MFAPNAHIPHLLRLDDDRPNLVKCLNLCEPGDADYEYYAECLETNDARLKIRDLMIAYERFEFGKRLITAFHEHGLGFTSVVQQVTRSVYEEQDEITWAEGPYGQIA